jgi:hypothetical protein
MKLSSLHAVVCVRDVLCRQSSHGALEDLYMLCLLLGYILISVLMDDGVLGVDMLPIGF